MNNEKLLIRALVRIFKKILVFKTEEQIKDTLVEYFSKDFVEKHIQISGFTDDSFVFYLVDEEVLKFKFTVTPQKVDGITEITGGNIWF